MSDIQIHILFTLVSLPLTYIGLRVIFKRSIVFKFSYLTFLMVQFVGVMNFAAGQYGIMADIWAIPIMVAVITGTFSIINRKLRKPLTKVILQVEELSRGNLFLQLKERKGKDELVKLNNALLQLQQKQKETISHIKNNSSELRSANLEASSASNTLANGANEQAASTEEVTSSIEELLAGIKQNAESSQEANEIAQGAEAGMEKIMVAVNHSVTLTQEISEKIKTISKISEKTDILAVNAEIEAAKAGVAGKGFSVVAKQVRSLAETTNKASTEIIELSKKNLSSMESTEHIITVIAPEVIKTSEIVKSISSASSEQKTSIEQISLAIHQLNDIAQQNTLSAEQISSQAEGLNILAEKLEKSISFFKLNIEELDDSTEYIINQIEKLQNKLAEQQELRKQIIEEQEPIEQFI